MDGAYEEISTAELIQLCAADSELFCKTFFKKAFRQESPSFANRFWEKLNGDDQFVLYQLFRGSGKTTRLRAYTAQRVGYGVSRTILFVALSEAKAAASIRWIKRQVQFNPLYRDTFQLRKGKKWSDTEIEIYHGIDEVPITIVGFGITGPLRGINFDDFRPDLIILDDILDEENSATADQRAKIDSLVYGALVNGLAPRSEAPMSKMVALQTPLNRDDYSCKAIKDPSWSSLRIGCWTPETEDLPDEKKQSIWQARWSNEELRKKKQDYVRRNQLSIWMREQECKVIAPELNTFMPDWLKEFDVLPPGLMHIISIDPVPPPSDKQLREGLLKKDYESIAVIGKAQKNFYIREISVNRGHDPSWTTSEFFRLVSKYRAHKAVVEAIGYQRVLEWILKQSMKDRKQYVRIDPFVGTSSKFNRIVDALSRPGGDGQLHVPKADSPLGRSDGIQMFIQQFNDYPNVSNDDALESVAVGIADLSNLLIYDEDVANDDAPLDEDEYKTLEYAGREHAP